MYRYIFLLDHGSEDKSHFVRSFYFILFQQNHFINFEKLPRFDPIEIYTSLVLEAKICDKNNFIKTHYTLLSRHRIQTTVTEIINKTILDTSKNDNIILLSY